MVHHPVVEVAGYQIALGLGDRQRVCDLHRVERFGGVASAPPREPAIVVLHRGETRDISLHRGVDRCCGGHPLRVERREHLAQCGDRHDAGGPAVAGLVRVLHDVQHRVGERLQRGRRRADLKPAELRDHTGGSDQRLVDGAGVHGAIGGEGLGGRRRVDRQFHRRRVGYLAADRRDAERCGAGLHRRHREAHLHAAIGRHGDRGALRGAGCQVGGLQHHVDGHRCVRLVLQHDRQLERVAVIREPWGRRPHRQRQAGGDVRLGTTEAIGATDRDHHHAVAGEVVGQRDIDGRGAVGTGRNCRLEQCQRIEVRAHSDRVRGRTLPATRAVATRRVGGRGTSGGGRVLVVRV